MRRICIMIILIFSGLAGYSPGHRVINIHLKEGINPYEHIAYAVAMVESNADDKAYNKKEKAMGRFQVRPIRLKDFNKRTGKHYTLNDMKDPAKAKSVFLYYCFQYHYNDIESISRCWNGGERGMKKRSTKKYYQKVLVYYNK
jgi:hypothetical protein